jgi:polyisoprenoid-binding protein YceI
MGMSKFKFLSAFFLFLSLSAGASVWEINKDHSEIFFQVPYLTVSEVTGRFNRFSGQVEFPEGRSLPSHVLITIETASLDTGNRQRDGHLRSQAFLRAKTHPHMTFEGRSFTELRHGQLRAQGTLTIAGTARPFSIDFSLTDPVKDTWNYENRFVRFRSKINRKDFKIVWNKTLTDNQYLVGEDITFWGTFQLQPRNLSTPSSKHMIPDTTYIRKREKLNRGEITADGFPKLEEKAAPVMRGKKTSAPDITPLTPAMDKAVEVEDIRGRTSWQVAFWTLGLFGFFACIILGLYTKKFVSEHWPQKYSEGGVFGILTDSVTIPLVFLYALAFWEVGWGL